MLNIDLSTWLSEMKAPLTISGGTFGSINDLCFQVVVELGVTKNVSDSSSTMVMKLNPRTHNFSFNADGSLEMKVEYNGVIESVFAEPVLFDILKLPKGW